MIKIVCVGKMKDKALVSLVSEYTKRISPFSKVEILEVKDESNIHAEREAESERVKDIEAERVLAKLRGTDLVVLLDLHGRMWNSEDFARRLGDWQQKSGQRGGDLVFVIGDLWVREHRLQPAPMSAGSSPTSLSPTCSHEYSYWNRSTADL